MSVLTAYADDRIGYRYGVRDPAYSKGYHRGQDVRLVRGGGSVVTDVVAIDAGRVVYVGRPNTLLGLTVVIDTGRVRGRYESHSHLADVSVTVGQQLASGDRLARNAQMWEAPGFITGVHDHITITDHMGGAWETWRNEYDPLPFIRLARIRAASLTPTPFPDPAQPEEETDMRFLYCHDSGGHLWTLINTSTAELIQTRDQSIANTWAQAWGGARTCDVLSFLNALDAVRKTTVTRATRETLATLDGRIADLRAELAA